MKKCARCRKHKLLEDFSKAQRNKDGRSSYCKTCATKYTKQWQRDNPERSREHRKQQRTKNPELFLFQVWKSTIKAKYGISAEQYVEMLNKQEHRCAICGCLAKEHKTKLVVDHDHKTGKVRGLLCYGCNWIIGHAHDNSEVLRKASEYLLERQ